METKKGDVTLIREDLICSDIIFIVINESLDRIEPIIFGFKSESEALNNIAKTVFMNDRTAVVLRMYQAKADVLNVQVEVEEKIAFLNKIKKLGKRGLLLNETMYKVAFMQRRTDLLASTMCVATALIQSAID